MGVRYPSVQDTLSKYACIIEESPLGHAYVVTQSDQTVYENGLAQQHRMHLCHSQSSGNCLRCCFALGDCIYCTQNRELSSAAHFFSFPAKCATTGCIAEALLNSDPMRYNSGGRWKSASMLRDCIRCNKSTAVLLLLLLDCCCLRGKSLSSRILEDRFTSHCPCPWTTKSSKIVKDSALCKQSVMCDYVKFISSVTATMHEDMMKNVLLTDVRYYLLMSVSKPFFAVSHSSCKVAKLAYLSNGLHLVLKCNFFTYL